MEFENAFWKLSFSTKILFIYVLLFFVNFFIGIFFAPIYGFYCMYKHYKLVNHVISSAINNNIENLEFETFYFNTFVNGLFDGFIYGFIFIIKVPFTILSKLCNFSFIGYFQKKRYNYLLKKKLN